MFYQNTSSTSFSHPVTHQTIFPGAIYEGAAHLPHEEHDQPVIDASYAQLERHKPEEPVIDTVTDKQAFDVDKISVDIGETAVNLEQILSSDQVRKQVKEQVDKAIAQKKSGK